MNFRYMPELELPWGYYAVLILMLVIALLTVAYFRRKKWILDGLLKGSAADIYFPDASIIVGDYLWLKYLKIWVIPC
jgi:hypothetical protein